MLTRSRHAIIIKLFNSLLTISTEMKGIVGFYCNSKILNWLKLVCYLSLWDGYSESTLVFSDKGLSDSHLRCGKRKVMLIIIG